MVAGDRPGTSAVGGQIGVAWTELEPRTVESVVEALSPVDVVWDAPDEPAVVARGQVARITAGGTGRFSGIRRDAHELFDRVDGNSLPSAARPRLLGGFAFFGNDDLGAPWSSFPPAGFSLPEIQVLIEDERTLLSVFADPTASGPTPEEKLEATAERIQAGFPEAESADSPPAPKVTDERYRASESDWRSLVGKITDAIHHSALRKVVLAQALDIQFEGTLDASGLLESLGRTYPDCYRFAFRGWSGGQSGQRSKEPHQGTQGSTAVFFGASPERLVKKAGTDISTEALAGTMDRGATPDADAANAEHLRTNPKLQEEHAVVVEQIRAQLDKIGDEVAVGDRSVRKLATVQHLQSPIRATVDVDTHVLEIVDALHPTPAVGGLPPDAAMAVIREHDPIERGWYAGPVGWFDAEGDGTFAVAIRSALADGDRATLFAGNGIVADSDPATEWSEVELKFQPIRSTLE